MEHLRPETLTAEDKAAKAREKWVVVHEHMVRWFSPTELMRTGLKAGLAGAFGSYADRREMQAALSKATPGADAPSDLTHLDNPWIDYVADLGDGWNSTYSIAYLIGQKFLEIQGVEGALPRGQVLIMGGDQVYPTASRETYQNRLHDPYRCARPWILDDGAPWLYAIPGNHDWYDGLTNFMRRFCQPGRWIGAWRPAQTRSYFTLELRHGWWIWGIDVQLESDVDRPQLEYFEEQAAKLKPEDRVILCVPEPLWIEEHKVRNEAIDDARKPHENLTKIEELIEDRHARVAARIAGDLHQFSHYSTAGGSGHEEHNITSGGGGAFLLGTHELPKTIRIAKKNRASMDFQRRAVFPSAQISKRLRWRALFFPFFNFTFGVLLGFVYLMWAWFMQSRSKVPHEALGICEGGTGEISCSLMEYFASVDSIKEVWTGVVAVMSHSPASAALTLGVLAGLCAFCVNANPRASKPITFVAGLIHGLAHVAWAVMLLWLISRFSLNTIAPHFGMSPHEWLDSTGGVATYSLITLTGGGIIGGFIIGLYLCLSNWRLGEHEGWHWQEVFSATSIQDYKHFLRMEVTREKITIYPIGLRRVCRRWKLAREARLLSESAPAWVERMRRWHWMPPRREWAFSLPRRFERPVFEPVNEADLKVELICAPIVVRA